ncbi:hypothetical protein PTKIN_Ptkin17bG0032100 [Pterospermum kingtungense]
MPSTKVTPAIIRSWSDMQHHPHHRSLKLSDKWEDDYGSGNRHGHDYWHARRTFLNSYHFREQNGFKEKLKRSMKKFNEAASNVIANYVRKLSRKRLGVRIFRVKFGLPTLVLVSMRCFTPWLKKSG